MKSTKNVTVTCQPRFHVTEGCEVFKLRTMAPRIIESRGTPSKFFSYTRKILCAKYDAFFHSVNVSPKSDAKPHHY